MTELKIKSGMLEPAVKALGKFEGKKTIPLSMRVVGMQQTLGGYLTAWRTEELNPAIREFTDGKDLVKEENTFEFLTKYDDIFKMDVLVGIEPLKASELPEHLTLDDASMTVLMETGLIVDA